MKRKKNKDEDQTKQVFATKELVQVESNLIVAWLLSLKAWLQKNWSYLKNIFIIALFSICIAGIFIFLYSSLIEQQNYIFFKYMGEFKEAKELTSKNNKNKRMSELNKKAHKACHVFFKTSHSYNTCLIEAATFIQMNEPQKASFPLDLFGQKNSDNGAGIYALFFAAQIYENLLQFKKAYEIYHQIDEPLKAIKKNEISLFSRGKILLIEGKLELAEKVFYELLDEFPNSKLVHDVHPFLNLLAFRKREKLLKK